MITSLRTHLWLTVPSGCRMEGEVISLDEFRFVFGDPREDGHTIEFDRDALERLRVLAAELLVDDQMTDTAGLVRVSQRSMR